MSRDDSVLYSGSSSASYSTNRIREDILQEKKEKRGKLRPAAELVFAEIKAEMESVMFIQNIDIANAKDERMFMVEMMARQRYVNYLKLLQNKLDNVLREPRVKGTDDE